MSSKTIWIINQYSGTPEHGMVYRSYYLAKEMIRQGHRVIVISGSYSHLFRKFPDMKSTHQFEIIDGIEYLWINVSPYGKSISVGRFKAMLQFAQRLKSVPMDKMGRPDAIILSSPSLLPVRTAYKWSRRFKAKFLFEVRDIWPLSIQVMGQLSSAHPLVMLFRHFEKFGHKQADYSVSVLPNAKQHFINAGMPEKRFVHIPNGIDLSEADNALPVSSDVLSRFPENKFIVGYAGTIGTANAMNFLMEAVIRSKEQENIHFVVVGSGDKLEELKAMVKDCSNITFIPPVPKRMVHSLIRMFDVCYMGMLNDPLYSYGISPNKIFDYLYSGRPVILAVNSPGNPVERAGGVVIEPENTDALVSAIEKLYAMTEEQRNAIGVSGRNYVLQNHTYPALVQHYITLIG